MLYVVYIVSWRRGYYYSEGPHSSSEIRRRIYEKCIRDPVSTDDEEESHERRVCDAEKLFDTLIESDKRKVSENQEVPDETVDSSSMYQGTIPSRLLSPGASSKKEAEDADPSEGLTQRFEAFKQINSQKTLATETEAAAKQTPPVPSFTLEEEGTTHLEEVTTGVQRAITLCEEEEEEEGDDSDVDLDVVMNKKR